MIHIVINDLVRKHNQRIMDAELVVDVTVSARAWTPLLILSLLFLLWWLFDLNIQRL